MTYCDVCENKEKEKRSGVCATCIHNITYTNHLKVSMQVQAILKHFDSTLDELIEENKKD